MAFLALPIGFTTIPLEISALLKEVGWMAFPIVEVMNVFLIDFPMSMLAAILFSIINKKSRIEDGVMCGFLYLSILILLIIPVGLFTENAKPMIKGAIMLQQNLGLMFPVLCVLFLLMDYGMCMLGGVLGVIIVNELRR
jgi:hypothetical protein